ncbi:MAG TPA: HAMP domain-containing histidine kinase [Oceanospirillales bacterium]|nr:HAMP domain-containing histidine kinase [Oceanospirillales bacterium]
MRSLRNQLNFSLMGSLMVLVLVLWWIANSYITNINKNMMLGRLQHDAEAILASLELQNNGEIGLKDLQVGHIYQRIFSGHYYVIKTKRQLIRSHSLWDENLIQAQLETGRSLRQDLRGPNNQPLVQLSMAFKRFGQEITLTVAEDSSGFLAAIHQFNLYFAITALIVLLLSLLLQRLMIKRALLPLSQIKNELQQLAEGKISQLSSQAPLELNPLIEEINHLLQLLSKQLQRSRKATGNLAHSLKHPLTLLMNLTESKQLKTLPKINKELITQVNKIQLLSESELKRAKMMGASIHGHVFKVQKEITVLLTVLKGVYPKKKLNVRLNIEENCEILADRNDMLEIFGNLLDNAFKWAKSQIICRVTSNKGVTITIEDDGNGCDKNLLDSLTQRGTQVDSDIDGTGLGLAIVKDLVELYGGSISFAASHLGGLKILIEFSQEKTSS